MILFHCFPTLTSDEWLQFTASIISNVVLISTFDERVVSDSKKKSILPLHPTQSYACRDGIPIDGIAHRFVLYDRWPSIAKDLFHKRLTWSSVEVEGYLKWLLYHFTPSEIKKERVDLMSLKHLNHMQKMFPTRGVEKQVERLKSKWKLDESIQEVSFGLKEKFRKRGVQVLPLFQRPRCNRMIEATIRNSR